MGALIPVALPMASNEKVRKSFGILTGTLVYDAKVTNFRRMKVSLIVKYGRRQYMRCTVFGDNVFFNTARRLLAGDTVMVMGEYKAQSYMKNDKETGTQVPKEAYDLYVEFLMPAALVADPNEYAKQYEEDFNNQDPFLSNGEINPNYDGDAVMSSNYYFSGAETDIDELNPYGYNDNDE